MPVAVTSNDRSLTARAQDLLLRPASARRGAALGLPPACRRCWQQTSCAQPAGPACGHGALVILQMTRCCSHNASVAYWIAPAIHANSSSIGRLPARCLASTAAFEADSSESANRGQACCTQWNIERGYELAKVVAALQAIDADVIALQEVDIGCDRSDNQDTGASCCAPPAGTASTQACESLCARGSNTVASLAHVCSCGL